MPEQPIRNAAICSAHLDRCESGGRDYYNMKRIMGKHMRQKLNFHSSTRVEQGQSALMTSAPSPTWAKRRSSGGGRSDDRGHLRASQTRCGAALESPAGLGSTSSSVVRPGGASTTSRGPLRPLKSTPPSNTITVLHLHSSE